MPYVFKHRRPPEPWHEARIRALHRAFLPFYFINWICEWIAYGLGKWSLLEVLEYAGSFTVLIAVIFYFADGPNRVKQKHYQAWQVINTAQMRGGSGGRIEALAELNEDGVRLVGVDVSGAFLQGINLRGAQLRRANIHAADMRDANLAGADLQDVDAGSTNLRGANLSGADLGDADFSGADLNGANLRDTRLGGSKLDGADLRGADMTGIQQWQAIRSIRQANVYGVRNAPAGFVAWAMQAGAVDVDDDRILSH